MYIGTVPSKKSVVSTPVTLKQHVSNVHCARTTTCSMPSMDAMNRRYSSTAVGFPRNLNQNPRPQTVSTKFPSRATAHTSVHARTNHKTPSIMIVENLEVLQETTQHVILNTEPTVSEYVPLGLLTYIVMNIYLNNYTSKSLTNHVKQGMTIITSQKNVSVIWGEHSTSYRLRVPLCLYEDLITDLETILSCIDICVDRLIDQ